MMKVVSLIFRVSLVIVASLLCIITPAIAQNLIQVNPASRIELVSKPSELRAIQPHITQRPAVTGTNLSNLDGCNCDRCTQARLLLTGKLPLASLL